MPGTSRLPKVSVSPTFLISVAVHLWFGLSAWLKDLLLAALLHELGHMVALWYYGVPIRDIRLTSLGAVMRVGAISCRAELVSAAAGPVVNALLAAAFIRPFPIFGLCNLGLFLFNILPLYPLDGGRMLRAVLQRRLDPLNADRTESTVAVICASLVMVLSVLAGRFVTHDLIPPLLSASVLLRPVLSETAERRKQFTLDKDPIVR